MGNYNLIGICGSGNSGASAVRDVLYGCKEVYTYKNSECQILHQSDGLLDLKHYIVDCRDKISSNAAIKRFIKSLYDWRGMNNVPKNLRSEYQKMSLEYVEKLVVCKWNGFSAFDPSDVGGGSGNWFYNKSIALIGNLGKLFNVDVAIPLSKERYFSMLSESVFNRITSDYLAKYFHMLGYSEDKPIVLEQFFTFSHPTMGMEFFDSAKAIIVKRDPRDVYVGNKYTIKSQNGPKSMGRFMPTDNVDNFIKYYMALHSGIEEDKRLLNIQFEDLIYKNDITLQKIADFLNIKRDANFGKTFKPEKSIHNTKIFYRYPEIEDEIKKIEKSLPQFLYDY